MSELRRELNLLDATMINVGTMIASAIFIVPAAVAASLQAPGLMVAVWLIGGVVSLLGALCVAELGAAMPEAGGQFVFLERAYGPAWGFLYAWTAALIINPASIAAIAVGCATYAGFFLPLTPNAVKAVAVLSIAGLTALNCLGLRPGALTQNVLTLVKIAALLALVVLGFVLPGGSSDHFRPWFSDRPLGALVGPVGVAMVAVLWAYDGWIEITYVGSEVKRPERTIPRSIVWSVGLVALLYTLATLVYTYLLSPAAMAQSSLVASDAGQVVLGRLGAAFVAAAIIVSTLGANNGIVLTAARIPFAVSRARLFFDWMGRVHPRFRTPVPSLIVQGLLSAALALTGTYDQLFTYMIFASWVFYALTCAAVIRLRHSAPELPRPYRAWGYPATPVVFIAFSAWLVFSTIAQSPRESLWGTVMILAGLPVYAYWSRVSARRA